MKWLGIVWDDARFWMHVPIGAAIVVLQQEIHWSVSLSMTLLFLIYEVCEDWRLKDGAYVDIQGGIGGIIFASIGYILWRIIV